MTATTQPVQWPNPWTEEPETRADDAILKGHDVPNDHNGLQISMARYIEHMKARRAQTTKEVAA